MSEQHQDERDQYVLQRMNTAETERDRYQATLRRIRDRYQDHGTPALAMVAEWCHEALADGGAGVLRRLKEDA